MARGPSNFRRRDLTAAVKAVVAVGCEIARGMGPRNSRSTTGLRSSWGRSRCDWDCYLRITAKPKDLPSANANIWGGAS